MDANKNEPKIAELSVEVRHSREDIGELKVELKELSDRHNESSHEIVTLQEQQNQHKQEFSDRKEVEKELKASWQQIRSELEPIRSLCQMMNKTPGGLTTWIAIGTISLLVSLTVIDTGVRAIGADRLLRHWLIQQSNLEEVMPDD